MLWLLLQLEILFEILPTNQLLYQMSLSDRQICYIFSFAQKIKKLTKSDAKEPEKSSSLFSLIPGQNPVPALPTIQLTCNQFTWRCRCVLRVAAIVKLGNPSSRVSKHLYF